MRKISFILTSNYISTLLDSRIRLFYNCFESRRNKDNFVQYHSCTTNFQILCRKIIKKTKTKNPLAGIFFFQKTFKIYIKEGPAGTSEVCSSSNKKYMYETKLCSELIH